MNRRIVCFFFAGLLAAWLFPGAPTAFAAPPAEKQIIGSWLEQIDSQKSTFTFSADHKFSNSLVNGDRGNHGTGDGTWKLEGARLLLTFEHSTLYPGGVGKTIVYIVHGVTADTLSFGGETVPTPSVYKRIK